MMAAPDLGKMYGPLPLGGWLAAGALGGAIALYRRRNAAAAPPAAREGQEVADAIAAAGPAVVVPGGGIILGPDRSVNVGQDVGGIAGGGAPQTNNQWASRAASLLIADGINPALVDTALGKYLMGDCLDRPQQAVLEEALRRLGPPPLPRPAPADCSVTPAPTPTTRTWGKHVVTGTGPPAPGKKNIWTFGQAAGHIADPETVPRAVEYVARVARLSPAGVEAALNKPAYDLFADGKLYSARQVPGAVAAFRDANPSYYNVTAAA